MLYLPYYGSLRGKRLSIDPTGSIKNHLTLSETTIADLENKGRFMKKGSVVLREHKRLVKRIGTVDFSAVVWEKGDSAVFSPLCVEIARKSGIVAVRDSKDLSIAPLKFTNPEWKAFLSAAKCGKFDV